MKILKYSVTAVFLILTLFACNLPAAEQVPPPSDAQTAAALTVQAILTIPVSPSATEPQSVIPVTPSATATVFAATITPTYSTPMLTVKEQTNCRTGPGDAYQIVFTYLPNKKLEILGRYDQGNFWLVKSAESSTGQCWLWGEYVEVTGSYWAVSSVTPPATATKSAPNAPTYQKWDYSCSYNGVNTNLNVTLIWTDHADNETGYRVIRDGQLLVELPPNSTSYADVVALDSGESATYRIDAYNSTGAASTSTISLNCNG